MGNVLKLLKRDAIRLLKAPAALVVVIALLVLPSVYTWYNVLGFWDPYGNTGNIRVAIVNQDKGANHELAGDINVGQMVEDDLRENDQLAWWFADYDEAWAEVQSGKSYAMFVIGEDFSSDMLTVLTGDFKKPTLQYYVNEKAGPVAPKITDAGATSLEENINSAFVEAVSRVVVDKIVCFAEDANALIDSSTSQAVAKINSVQASMENTRSALSNASSTCDSIQGQIVTAKQGIDDANTILDEADIQLDAIIADIERIQKELEEISGNITQDSTEGSLEISSAATLAAMNGYADAAEDATDITNKIPSSSAGVIASINTALGKLSSASAELKAAIANERITAAEAKIALDQLSSVVASTKEALKETSSLLGSIEGDLNKVKTDLLALASSDSLASLIEAKNLNAETISEFIGAPTELVTEKLYPFNSYGAAMAPLFMNLTFWIGAFMLLIIMRQEVDSEGVANLTLSQRFIERYLIFASMVVIQAVVCCLGIMALGVEVANPIALCFAAAMTSLTFLAIIYTLSVLFQHIGKGICIILIFLQIPAATGLYPIEMTAPFYQAIYPILPFTYGIRAMREGIAGFYGADYVMSIVVLLVYLVIALALGLLFRTPMSNVNRMVAHNIDAGGIYNGENLDLPVRQYRSSQILRVLVDKEEYRRDFLNRYVRFNEWYPAFTKIAVILTVLIPLAATIFLSLANGEKVVLLTIWLVWIVIMICAFIFVEYMRYRFVREMELDSLSQEELLDLFKARNRVVESKVHARDTGKEINRRDAEYIARADTGKIDWTKVRQATADVINIDAAGSSADTANSVATTKNAWANYSEFVEEFPSNRGKHARVDQSGSVVIQQERVAKGVGRHTAVNVDLKNEGDSRE